MFTTSLRSSDSTRLELAGCRSLIFVFPKSTAVIPGRDLIHAVATTEHAWLKYRGQLISGYRSRCSEVPISTTNQRREWTVVQLGRSTVRWSSKQSAWRKCGETAFSCIQHSYVWSQLLDLIIHETVSEHYQQIFIIYCLLYKIISSKITWNKCIKIVFCVIICQK